MSEADSCVRTVTLGDQSHPLTLNHPWVRKVLSLRGINGKTPTLCMLAFETGAYSIEDVEAVITLGLIGGGMGEQEADKLVGRYVSKCPVAENANSAAEVLAALLLGKEAKVISDPGLSDLVDQAKEETA